MSGVKLSNHSINSREIKYDLLKTLGILLIILAHVIPPNTLLFQIRNFDVPLMLIIAGILFYRTTKAQNTSYLSYLKKRLPRLIAPVWLFLTFFFLAVYLIDLLLQKPYSYSSNTIIETFFLEVGIPYIWIVRVFTHIALLSPLVLIFYQKIQNKYWFLLIIAAVYSINEILFNIFFKTSTNLPGESTFLLNLELNFFSLIPWLCTFSLGIILPQFSRKTMISWSLFLFSIFLILAFHFSQATGHFVATQDYKYPPQLYYLSYAISISFFLLTVVDLLPKPIASFLQTKNSFTDAIIFISSSTLWIFLWHIFFLEYQPLWTRLFPSLSHYLIKYVIIASLAILFTYIQKLIVTKFIKANNLKPVYSDWLTVLFLK